LTIATVVAGIDDDPEMALAFGIPATVIGGVVIPIVAAGGSSAAPWARAQAHAGIRQAGWVLYSFALADAVTLIGLTIGEIYVPPAVAASVGLLGAVSCSFMSYDAFHSAAQAKTLAAVPRLTLIRDAAGHVLPSAAFGVEF
jgi:hypothetical protein